MAALVGATICLFAASSAHAEKSVRVDPEYFGVNYPLIHFDPPQVRDAQLKAISQAGIGTVRAALSWAALEPSAPTGTHNYDYTASDKLVGELAAHGLRLSPAFMYTPAWAAPMEAGLLCAGQIVTTGSVRPGDYADAAAALVRRYGPKGTFWAEHPQLPKMPITTWQIWNEPNLRTYWCPNPNPDAYAEHFKRASEAIHAVDKNARVVTAGLVLADGAGSYVGAGDFWAALGRRNIWQSADGIGFHVFPGGTIDRQFEQIILVRNFLNAAGAPKTMPMFGTEIGWGLSQFGLTEAERAQRYAFLTERLPSSNCNVGLMYAHAWTTSPPGGIVWDYDSGIADAITGALFPSAIAFRDAIKILSGRGNREALHENLRHCKDMPKLDRDRDKRAEHRDYYPLDKDKWQGPPGWYDGVKVRAKRKQRLGRPIVVNAVCDEACRVKVSGRVRLSGVKGGLKLKKVRKKLKGGKAKQLKLKLTKKAAARIEDSGAERGKVAIKASAFIEDERFQAGPAKVKLR